MKTHSLYTVAQDATHGSFRVATPRAGDVVATSLHRAYDDGMDLPDDISCLLDSLYQID